MEAAAQDGSQSAKESVSQNAQGTDLKRGYLIANYTVHDEKTYQKYIEAASLLNERFQGKAVIYDRNCYAKEGDARAVIAIAEFPSLAAAEQFYYSVEYQQAMKYRLASTTGSVLLAESFMPE